MKHFSGGISGAAWHSWFCHFRFNLQNVSYQLLGWIKFSSHPHFPVLFSVGEKMFEHLQFLCVFVLCGFVSFLFFIPMCLALLLLESEKAGGGAGRQHTAGCLCVCVCVCVCGHGTVFGKWMTAKQRGLPACGPMT